MKYPLPPQLTGNMAVDIKNLQRWGFQLIELLNEEESEKK